MSTPPFQITPQILNLCTQITKLLGIHEGMLFPRVSPQMRKTNRIQTIHSTLWIEGNTLSLEQITTLLEGKRVIGPSKDIQEVQNAISVYERLNDWEPFEVASFLEAHAIMTQGLIDESGCWRSSNVGILQGGKVAHVAPQPNRMGMLIETLFEFVRTEPTVHPLIKSALFHYEVEFIHPFADGNGRMGRLWQQVLLMDYHSLFEFVSIESVVKAYQEDYYAALSRSDKAGHSTVFVEFSLTTILSSLEQLIETVKPTKPTAQDRIQQAKRFFQDTPFSRKDYCAHFPSISTATASRDLRQAVERGMLQKRGDKALTQYCFIQLHE